jgi:hypothetical protein
LPPYDPVVSDRKTSLTVAVDPSLVAYAEQLVEAGKADRDAVDRLRETAAKADPAKVARMMAHVDAQAAALGYR